MLGLRVLGEGRLVPEDLVEKNLVGSASDWVYLEGEHARSAWACGRNFLMMPVSASTSSGLASQNAVTISPCFSVLMSAMWSSD
jgi:hypothetical protein